MRKGMTKIKNSIVFWFRHTTGFWTMFDGRWHHVAIVFRRFGKSEYYLDDDMLWQS